LRDTQRINMDYNHFVISRASENSYAYWISVYNKYGDTPSGPLFEDNVNTTIGIKLKRYNIKIAHQFINVCQQKLKIEIPNHPFSIIVKYV